LFAFLLFCIVFKVQRSSAWHHASRASLFILSPFCKNVNTFSAFFSAFFESFSIVELLKRFRLSHSGISELTPAFVS